MEQLMDMHKAWKSRQKHVISDDKVGLRIGRDGKGMRRVVLAG
jgi:hypothetical protein